MKIFTGVRLQLFFCEIFNTDASKKKSKDKEECNNFDNFDDVWEFKKDLGKSDLFTLLDFWGSEVLSNGGVILGPIKGEWLESSDTWLPRITRWGKWFG